eukprot:CAMPEP_0114125932 /NCGR_PEP_ID=MMETSP0043_2-20121206/9559_1 /TAXON_ID=464988 /ORGANISM="Hemiselmis andersenii, Strain CCMP644" /LENGTH=107 /DNA_ID=CAMNT_0001218881 /DNA_START=34 /DNA_END=357 /DNA_ORIENTATION=-
MIRLESVFEAKLPFAKLARNGDKLLLSTPRKITLVLLRLNPRLGAARADVLVYHLVGVLPGHDGDGLHAQGTRGGVLVGSGGDGAVVLFMPMVVEAELLATPVTGEW